MSGSVPRVRRVLGERRLRHPELSSHPQRDHVAGKAHRRTSGAVAGSGAEEGTEEELNMEEDEADSSGALDAAAAAAQLAEVRRQVAAVEQRVRAGELPEEVQTTLDVAPEPFSRNQHPVIRFSADRVVAEFKVTCVLSSSMRWPLLASGSKRRWKPSTQRRLLYFHRCK